MDVSDAIYRIIIQLPIFFSGMIVGGGLMSVSANNYIRKMEDERKYMGEDYIEKAKNLVLGYVNHE